jgi:hypothetical protein
MKEQPGLILTTREAESMRHLPGRLPDSFRVSPGGGSNPVHPTHPACRRRNTQDRAAPEGNSAPPGADFRTILGALRRLIWIQQNE